MTGQIRVLRSRIAGRAALTAMAVAVLVVTAAGAAWAARDVTKGRPYSGAQTYYMQLTPTASGEDGVVSRSVQVLKIGDASIDARCDAGIGEGPELVGLNSFVSYSVRNNGDNPILVATSGEKGDYTGPQFMWLQPGQQDPVFWAGQIAGSDVPDQGAVIPFTIMDDGGVSVTGAAAVSVRLDTASGTAHCAFTAQAQG